jgi:acetyl esterase/lipase
MKTNPFLLATFASLTALTSRADLAAYSIEPDVIYGHKLGMALTMDAIKPKANANGAGVLFMVSGGWVSTWMRPEAVLDGEMNKSLGFTALLDKGFTVFLVRHGSSPVFKVPECVDDVRRACRYVHLHAADWGLDPARLGVFGASAGGHLSLMLGTTGDEGRAGATDPLEKTGDRVAAVVAIFPPSELKSYVESETMRKRFPALQFDAADWRPVSPIEHVSADDAATLLLHGDQDTLVPDSHSRQMYQALKEKGVATELVIFPGAGHGFGGDDRDRAMQALVAWFDKHLAKAKPAEFALAGVWKGRATLPDGGEFPSTVTFTREGDKWKATSESERGTRALENVTLEGRKMKFETPLERDGEAVVIRVAADADGTDKLTGTWSVQRKEGGEEITSGHWEATREAKSVATTPGASPLAGEWQMEVNMGDQSRDYTLRFAPDGASVKGTLVSPRSGDHPVESAVLEKDELKMRIKRDYEGTELTLLFTARLENNALTGKVTVEGQEADFAGTWSAKKK